jgi:tetratricopeptide (TPR) repeat protein
MKKINWINLMLLSLMATGLPGLAAERATEFVPSGQSGPSLMKPLTGGVAQKTYGFSDDLDWAEAQVRENPEDPEAWFLLAVAYSRTPYVERALEGLEKSKKLARKHPEGFGIFDRKIAEYENMLAKKPDDALLLYRIGFGYYMRGYAVDHKYIRNSAQPASYYYDRSEDSFRHLLRVDPNDFMAMNYLGFLLAERDPEANFDQAVGLWRDSLQISPGNPGAYMLLGQAAMKKGNLRQAVEYSTKALQARNAWLEARQINPDTVKVRL